MYYPIQIPSIDNAFRSHVNYSEEPIPSLSGFVICVWTMQPYAPTHEQEKHIVQDLVLIDGCSELVFSYASKNVVFAAPSMTKTAYDETTNTDGRYIGIKFKPGAFTQLTGLGASHIDGRYLRLEHIDSSFCPSLLAGLSFEQSKQWLIDYVAQWITAHEPNRYVSLFDRLVLHPPTTTEQIYAHYDLSPRQCQRLFKHWFNLTPQMVLVIVRFHHCLTLLTQGQVLPNDMLELIQFSDQSHFIREIKRYCGFTPYQLLQKLASGD